MFQLTNQILYFFPILYVKKKIWVFPEFVANFWFKVLIPLESSTLSQIRREHSEYLVLEQNTLLFQKKA
jgi:hypothetical protein